MTRAQSAMWEHGGCVCQVGWGSVVKPSKSGQSWMMRLEAVGSR